MLYNRRVKRLTTQIAAGGGQALSKHLNISASRAQRRKDDVVTAPLLLTSQSSAVKPTRR